MEKNFPVLLNAYRTLFREYTGIAGVVAATTEQAASRLRAIAAETRPPAGLSAGWPESLRIVVRQTDETIRWCDLALVVSGTVTLQVARQHRPMVIVYKSSRLVYELIGRWVVNTKQFSLPNLVAGSRVVPELIPHFGGHEPIVSAAVELIEQPAAAAAQVQALREVSAAFDGSAAAEQAANAIIDLLNLAPPRHPAGERASASQPA
jgi:lipid-A-disaccharide synthase